MIDPKSGEIYICNLDPVLGSEQAGRRPAVVISSKKLGIHSKRVFICPITSNLSLYPTKYFLNTSYKTKGAVLLDQMRAVDFSKRALRYVETISTDQLLDIRFLISTLIFDFPENQMRDFILTQIRETS